MSLKDWPLMLMDNPEPVRIAGTFIAFLVSVTFQGRYPSLLTRIGGAVNFAAWNVQSFLDAATAQELLEALQGKKEIVQLETKIRLQHALQALQNGVSLTEITQQATEQLERYLIVQILEYTQGNKAETARILQVDYKTLYRKMGRYFGTFSDIMTQPYLHTDFISDDS
jgi:transcriptional regulator with PAS, ATPase and Fis domain